MNYFRIRLGLACWLLMCLAVIACAPANGMRDEESTIVAWYIEDLAHGIERQAGEVQLVGSSPALTAVTRWLTRSTMDGRVIPPSQLTARAMRWPALRGLFRNGLAVVLGDGEFRGLVAPRKDLSDEEQILANPIIDAENFDRRTMDSLVRGLANMSDGAARRYSDEVAGARISLDQAAGAAVWSTTSSP
jgi:hypothetical protein